MGDIILSSSWAINKPLKWRARPVAPGQVYASESSGVPAAVAGRIAAGGSPSVPRTAVDD
jgi:hypothetical protein